MNREQRNRVRTIVLLCLAAGLASATMLDRSDSRSLVPPGRREVVFWHFWGGADRAVVEQVVARFNASQQRHYVRAIAMPGNNLDMKLFLAVTGGDPPDVINQDDPIMADWAERGALLPLDEVASPDEVGQLRHWLSPAARQLGEYRGRMYALCNGLDVRALYYNQDVLQQYGLAPPTTLAELDAIAEQTTVIGPDGRAERYGYLPSRRLLWAWGVVFGGDFYDETTGQVTADSEPIVRALEWMTSYRERYGAASLSAFQQGDQALPGQTFPLLSGRYTLFLDGQWRVRDIRAAQEEQQRAGRRPTQFGVCALPPPAGGVTHAGWVNGNFFLMLRNAKNPAGAWEFMKFWSGFGGHEAEAAETCIAGGWLPVAPAVARQPQFAAYLEEQPLLRVFVDLAAKPHQVPIPVIPGAAYFQRTIDDTTTKSLQLKDAPAPRELLRQATRDIQSHLDAQRTEQP